MGEIQENIELGKEELEAKKEKLFQLFNELNEQKGVIQGERKNFQPSDFNKSYKKRKRELIGTHPEFHKIIETIFKINSFVHSHETINYHGEGLVGEQRKRELINLTSWQHQATEILIEMGWDKNLTEQFWQQVDNFFEIFSKYPTDFEGYKRGVSGQAQVFLLLQELGYHPQLASPKEDAFEGMDLYLPTSKEGERIGTQIKTRDHGQSIIELIDSSGSRGVVLDSRNGKFQTRFESRFVKDMIHVRQRCDDLSQKTGKTVKALLIIISEEDFDQETGEPRKDFLDKFRREIKSLEI